uniref:BY PROTMAP: gi/576995025/gb/EUC67555.1/ plant senescence-associated protein, putative [Rhizoctonia solani AG-3 Rhs1AP] gi/660959185/gb/KEP46523.1/ putative plant senescence-associated protein [Rhiz... n=1 Tax=Rhodotorula toruloides TaxID=5286 RepID=A0A0K3CRL0_RHOTO
MIGRADIEGSKSNVAMNAWLPQASYPCGNFSGTSSLKFRGTKGSIGHTFMPNSPPDNVFNPDQPVKDLNAKTWDVNPSSASLNK